VKHVLPTLFLFFCVFLFPKSIFATISLNISNIEKSESSYSLDASISGLSSSSNCYVQIAITAPSAPHYFGQTWSPKGEWFKYISSPAKEYITEYFVKLENDQIAKILFNTDPEDEDYKGPGEYLVKLNRYTGGSSSPAGDSNSLTLNISDPTPTQELVIVATETPTGTSTTAPTSTPTPTPTKTPTPTPTITPTKTPTTTKTITPTKLISSSSAVLGESTNSASLSAGIFVKSEAAEESEREEFKPTNYKIPFFIGIFLAISSGTLLYFRHQKD